MNNLLRWRDEHHMLPLLLLASLVMLIAIAAAVLWSRGTLMGDDAPFASRRLKAAYDQVKPGRTLQPELANLGFDASRLKARSISGLGVQEYFMPRTSRDFDTLDPAVRACFDSPDRCSVLVFPLGPRQGAGGFMAANAAPREPGHYVFLMRSGRVTYKAMDGI